MAYPGTGKVSDDVRKRDSTRPELEALETMTLLSGIGLGADAKPPALPNPLNLVGTVKGALTIKGTSPSLKVTGNLSPIGKVAYSISGPITSFETGPHSLSIPVGPARLFVAFSLKRFGTTEAGTYTVTGGTRTLAGETGSGALTVRLNPAGFTATFSPLLTPT